MYNINIRLYKKTANILEQYFSFIFTSINNCFNDNMKTIATLKLHDFLSNIHRDYSILINFIKYIYEWYRQYLFEKINEINIYLQTIEKTLLLNSWILIRGIIYCINFQLLP